MPQPFEHNCSGAQAIRHAVQFRGSVARFASHPFDASPSQSANPAEHVSTHTPATQSDAAVFTLPHTRPHAPQLLALSAIRVSQPVASRPSQSAVPIWHGRTHARFTHAASGLTDAQERPHTPQFVASERASISQPFAASRSQSR